MCGFCISHIMETGYNDGKMMQYYEGLREGVSFDDED